MSKTRHFERVLSTLRPIGWYRKRQILFHPFVGKINMRKTDATDTRRLENIKTSKPIGNIALQK